MEPNPESFMCPPTAPVKVLNYNGIIGLIHCLKYFFGLLSTQYGDLYIGAGNRDHLEGHPPQLTDELFYA